MKYIFLGIFFTVALPFFIVGGFLTIERLHQLNVGQRADGVVVEHQPVIRKGPATARKPTYAERVEFNDSYGNIVSITSETSSSYPSLEIGAKVEVLYPLANPQMGVIYNYVNFWLWPSLLVCIGIFLSGLGIILHQIFQRKIQTVLEKLRSTSHQ